MSRERVYPDERAGPFPEPPISFTDREGREIEVRGYPPGSGVPEALVDMYAGFDPTDRAQGIPPTAADAARRWLETIFADGYNAIAWHGSDAAGHATLVPADGGKAANAGDRPRQNAEEQSPSDPDARSRRDDGHQPGSDAGPASDAGLASDAGGAYDGGAATGTADATSRGPYELAIFVLQSYQRAGIGTRLLKGLLGYARAQGIERVWLSVERWNTPAIELYQTVGFETSDSRNFELEMATRL